MQFDTVQDNEKERFFLDLKEQFDREFNDEQEQEFYKRSPAHTKNILLYGILLELRKINNK